MNHTPEQWDGLVRRLNDGGCPVLRDHSYKISPVGLAIEKIPGMSFNQIFDLAKGGTGYEIELALRNDLDRPIDIVGYQIKTPWGIPKVSLLPAPDKSSPKYPHYSFPHNGPYYEGSFVLNRFFARRKSRLHPGEEIEGVLVASSEERIPLEFPHLSRIIATLIIFDSRRNAFSAQFRLPVIRREIIPSMYTDSLRACAGAGNEHTGGWRDPHPLALAAHPAPKEESLEEIVEALRYFGNEMARFKSERGQANKPIRPKIRKRSRPELGVGIGAGHVQD
jgi:hypothetical protein